MPDRSIENDMINLTILHDVIAKNPTCLYALDPLSRHDLRDEYMPATSPVSQPANVRLPSVRSQI